MKTKPFNLQLALEGHPVVCRCTDDEVKDVRLRGNDVFATLNGAPEKYDLYGHFAQGQKNPEDLRMAVLTEKRWIGVFKRDGRLRNTEYSYPSVAALKSSVISSSDFAGWQFIEIEVEV